MATGFDEGGVFYSDDFWQQETNEVKLTREAVKKRFKDFLRQFNEGSFVYTYRDALKRNYNARRYYLEVCLDDVKAFDEEMGERIANEPSEFLALLEEGAKEVADELTRPRPDDDAEIKEVQLMLRSSARCVPLRALKSETMSKLVKVVGIVVSTSNVRVKATRLTIQCRGCRQFVANINVRPGMDGYALPRRCATQPIGGGAPCPLDPFRVVTERCICIDYQMVKLQELPEHVPNGELPRHVTVYMDRALVDRLAPGRRAIVTGVYAIRRGLDRAATQRGNKGSRERSNVGVRLPYVRALGVDVDDGAAGSSFNLHANSVGTGASRMAGATASLFGVGFLGDPEARLAELMHRLAARKDIYELIVRSLAPSIYEAADVKCAIACLLFGGSRKRLPDGLFRRGDVNVLLIGDPGTAKSQLLKFVEKCAPIAVYTSGKGSSAAGLTASVNRDSQAGLTGSGSRGFVVEGGAMVLADGGVVCIDEFDKMREEDRVALHEAMEQQTISIAKAGITTVLNSRCSILAAANSLFGRWDDSRESDENIDLMPTILSRFDLIFIIRDECEVDRDTRLATHVLQLHTEAPSNANASAAPGAKRDDKGSAAGDGGELDFDLERDRRMLEERNELSLGLLKRYVAFCRRTCAPRLSEEAVEMLKSRYVQMRNNTREYEAETGKRCTIPITVRQLEALVRLSEALAKMRLASTVSRADVDEALRLFQVSTLDAALNGQLGLMVEGFQSASDQQAVERIEKQLKRRFALGSTVSEQAVIADFTHQKYPEKLVRKVIHLLIRRGELQYRLQRKMLYRVK